MVLLWRFSCERSHGFGSILGAPDLWKLSICRSLASDLADDAFFTWCLKQDSQSIMEGNDKRLGLCCKATWTACYHAEVGHGESDLRRAGGPVTRG